MTDHVPDTHTSTDATGPLALKSNAVLGPTAWRYVLQLWSDSLLTNDPEIARLAGEYGRHVQPLYELTPEEVAAVNKLRAEKARAAQVNMKLCQCDHNNTAATAGPRTSGLAACGTVLGPNIHWPVVDGQLLQEVVGEENPTVSHAA